jgi:hypothetical protein
MESKRQEPKPQDKHAYVLRDKLMEDQKRILKTLMKKYEDILATDFSQISHNKEPKFFHDIELIEGAQLINQKPYQIPLAYKEWVREETRQEEEAKIIRPSNSPWASPIVLAPKKDGSMIVPRKCKDY